jgi:hypothetical protein
MLGDWRANGPLKLGSVEGEKRAVASGAAARGAMGCAGARERERRGWTLVDEELRLLGARGATWDGETWRVAWAGAQARGGAEERADTEAMRGAVVCRGETEAVRV